jgi:Tfp pilus assembly protein PilF
VAGRYTAWRDNPTLFAQAVEDAPLSYTAHWAQAGVHYRNGLQRQAELHYRMALQLYDADADLHEDFGDRFFEHRLHTQAALFMRQALAREPRKWKARSKLIFSLIQLDSLPAAEAELALKRARGEPDAALVSEAVDSALRSRRAAPR